MIDTVLDVLWRTAQDVGHSLAANWPFLLISVVLASAIPVYIGAERLSAWMRRKTAVAVLGAIVLATLTPFCSCGTTAVVLGALAASVPWAPVVTFMVSSPLTSPEEYVYSTGLFGFDFATTFFVAAMILGVFAGFVTWLIEKTGWLAGQARLSANQAEEKASESCCGDEGETEGFGGGGVSAGGGVPAGGGGLVSGGGLAGGGGLARTALLTRPVAPEPAPAPAPAGVAERLKLKEFGEELKVNAKRLALYFLGFATLGFLLINSIPTSFLTEFLGDGNIFSVPIAALIGVPVYLNSDGSLPLVATLMQGGMGPGAALAFLVTGAGTSIGAISGMLLIARWRVVTLVVGILFTGAIVLGYSAPIWL
ncbi:MULTISPECIES: permease [unclassified Streptomyces]|uniref:permease n=1 Tax=unclassified Streptomyces TaxID=2593676 RepID=UPI0019D0E45C